MSKRYIYISTLTILKDKLLAMLFLLALLEAGEEYKAT